MHIAIAGNIGAGKTTLAAKLARHYGWDLLAELPDENPYLADFYEDMPRWAFQVQVHFLASRFEQVLAVGRMARPCVQDRTIYEDAHVFARNLHESKLMGENDYRTYLRLFDAMMQAVKPPDLLLFLDAGLPKLTLQVKKRGNSYETNVDAGYLMSLQHHYRAWIDSYAESPLLRIDVDALDFVARQADFETIVGLVDDAIAKKRFLAAGKPLE